MALFPSVALGDGNGELKMMMSGEFDGVEVVTVRPVVHIDQCELAMVEFLKPKTHRTMVAVRRQVDVLEHVGEHVFRVVVTEVTDLAGGGDEPAAGGGR